MDNQETCIRLPLGAQPDANASFPEGQNELPIWDFIPIECMIVPLLHILLLHF
jgi:hypothetical protein